MGVFSDFLKSITSISQCQEFKLSPDGCRVGTVNDMSSLRAYIETSIISSDREVTIPLKETYKLSKAVSRIYDLNDKDLKDQEMEFDGTFLRYNSGGYKFNFSTISRKVISKYIADDLKNEMVSDYGFKIDRKTFRNILTTSQICADDGTKVYFYKEDGKILVDIDDKATDNSDSISMPISEDFYGEWHSPFQCKLDVFRMFNVINSEEVNICATTSRVIQVTASTSDIDLKLITGITKK